MKTLAFVVALVLAVPIVSSCAPSSDGAPVVQSDSKPGAMGGDAVQTDAACAAQGGQMQRIGRLQRLQCVVRYADAGKPCTDASQCQGQCRADAASGGGRPEDGAAVAGRCQADSNPFGCYTRVINGRAEPTICVD